MPKQTTVVEFDDKEIREILKEKAKDSLGKPIQGGVEITFKVIDSTTQSCRESVSCVVTFNGKSSQ